MFMLRRFEGCNSMNVFCSRLYLAVALAAACQPVSAQEDPAKYPTKPIHIVVGFTAGGGNDIIARVYGQKLSEALGQPVIIENKPGGGAIVATEYVAKSAPDGYTLLMASNAIVINPSLYEKMPYDASKDLAPISLAVSMPIILVVNNDVPAKSVPELVALARAQPGQLTVGHAGVGTPAHLAGELFKAIAHVDVQQVPYRGIPVLLPDLLAGRLTMTFPNIAVALPLLRDGKLRALAVASPKRAAPMPDLPTMAEQGLAGIDATAWFGLMAPAGTPPAIVEKLHRETVRILGTADVRKRLDDLGMEVIANTPGEFAAVIRTETPQWAKVIRDAGIKLNE
jgi:tripartite-type tricarboxylate transporter receptor subunit TctC